MSLKTITEAALENISTLLDGLEWGEANSTLNLNCYTLRLKPQDKQKDIQWSSKMHRAFSRIGPILDLLLNEARSHSDAVLYFLPQCDCGGDMQNVEGTDEYTCGTCGITQTKRAPLQEIEALKSQLAEQRAEIERLRTIYGKLIDDVESWAENEAEAYAGMGYEIESWTPTIEGPEELKWLLIAALEKLR